MNTSRRSLLGTIASLFTSIPLVRTEAYQTAKNARYAAAYGCVAYDNPNGRIRELEQVIELQKAENQRLYNHLHGVVCALGGTTIEPEDKCFEACWVADLRAKYKKLLAFSTGRITLDKHEYYELTGDPKLLALVRNAKIGISTAVQVLS